MTIETVNELTSPQYRRVLQETHAREGNKWGGGGKYWAGEIIGFVQELGNISTVLDYGCGQGLLKRRLDDHFKGAVDVREYDPGIIGKDQKPEPADIVVCTDVLEHVEPELVQNVITHLRELTKRGAFVIIALGKTKLTLSDGRNAHLTVMPDAWWRAHLEKAGFKIMREDVHKAYKAWLR